MNKANVQTRLKELRDDKEAEEEIKVLKAYLQLLEKQSGTNIKIKEAKAELDKKLLAKYPTLTVDEIKALVVDDKWMAAIERDIQTEIDKISHRLTQRIKELAERYETPLPTLDREVLEYLYNLSDVEVANRINTDVAFRWFLGLGIDDEVPDDTTISYFRVKRLEEDDFDAFFNEIVKLCIEKDLVKSRRYIVDTTDVAANVNYPSDKKLIGNAFKKVIKEVGKFNESLAKQQQEQFEADIHKEYENNENVNARRHFEIAGKHLQYLNNKKDNSGA